jgi:hypothetical protein
MTRIPRTMLITVKMISKDLRLKRKYRIAYLAYPTDFTIPIRKVNSNKKASNATGAQVSG